MAIEIRKATTADIPEIARLVNEHADHGEMLHRSEDELFDVLRDFVVAYEDDVVLGCVSLHVLDYHLAEVRSLVVRDEARGRGLGRMLVDWCLDDAEGLGIGRVFALTAKPQFFEKLGFLRTPRSRFPQKIWRDCFNCRFFEACGEVAVAVNIAERRERVLAAAGPDQQMDEALRQREGQEVEVLPGFHTNTSRGSG